MAANLITGEGQQKSALDDYTDYTIMTFPGGWRALDAFANKLNEKYPNSRAREANNNYKANIDNTLQGGKGDGVTIDNLGLFGKQPRSFEDGMRRKNFVYYDEYKRIKETVEKKIREELAKTSIAEAMKPKLVFNDRELGEFVYDRAAMSLVPEMYYYSPSKKREINANEEQVLTVAENEYVLASDNSEVIFAFKVDLPDGGVEYVKVSGESSLEEASKRGIVNVSSNNKKVYLYKEKKPKVQNAIKIVVGLTAGGYTYWDNDFYTGVATGVALEILESLGYTVHVEVVVGGGRCRACYTSLGKSLNLPTNFGRRFFMFTAKSFDEQADMDGLLYTICDPSFHRIKFIPLLNYFFGFFGDTINDAANPANTWHGIQDADMLNPIGAYIKHQDRKKGNDNLIHFYIHQVGSEQDVIAQIKDLVLTAENINLTVLKKTGTHNFDDNE